jgi:hypothetical protein
MELPDAQKEFMEILHRAKDPSVINGFLSWVKENWFAGDNNLNIGKYIHFITPEKFEYPKLFCIS